MHLGAHRKNSALTFNRLVDLPECDAGCRFSERDAAMAALAESDQSLSLEKLEELPHHHRVGPEAFGDCLRSSSLVAGVSDEAHDVDGTRQATVRGHNCNRNGHLSDCQARRCLRPRWSPSTRALFPVMPALLTGWAVLPTS